MASAPFTATPAADDPPSPAPSGKSLAISIVTLLPDGGWKYLSSGAWTDPIDEVVERATRINYW